MAARRFAFPVMDALNPSKSQMTEVTQKRLPWVREVFQLHRGFSSSLANETDQAGGVRCLLRVGEHVTLPITIVGSLPDTTTAASSHHLDEEVLIHAPGLAGAVPVRLSTLVGFRGALTPATERNVDETSTQLGSLCLLESVDKHGVAGDLLEHFYKRARRRSFTCQGSAALLMRGEEINVDGLALDFPYHCGGAQAAKRFLDVSNAACTHFMPHGSHGTKVLSRYGVAVAVGVAMDAVLQVPCLHWHPSGAPAACLAPILHGSSVLPVGMVKLAYNGPTSACEMLQREDPRRYTNPTVEGKYDETLWLTEGLFGARPGDVWKKEAEGLPLPGAAAQRSVLGVAFDEEEWTFELYLRDHETGEIVPANGV